MEIAEVGLAMGLRHRRKPKVRPAVHAKWLQIRNRTTTEDSQLREPPLLARGYTSMVAAPMSADDKQTRHAVSKAAEAGEMKLVDCEHRRRAVDYRGAVGMKDRAAGIFGRPRRIDQQTRPAGVWTGPGAESANHCCGTRRPTRVQLSRFTDPASG